MAIKFSFNEEKASNHAGHIQPSPEMRLVEISGHQALLIMTEDEGPKGKPYEHVERMDTPTL